MQSIYIIVFISDWGVFFCFMMLSDFVRRFVYIQIGIVVFTQSPIPISLEAVFGSSKTLDVILRMDFELRIEVQFSC